MGNDILPSNPEINDLALVHQQFAFEGHIRNRTFRRCIFQNSDLCNLLFDSCHFVDCFFTEIDASGTRFRKCSFLNFRMSYMDFAGAVFTDCRFRNDNTTSIAYVASPAINSCNFHDAIIQESVRSSAPSWENLLIDNGNFQNAVFHNVNFGSCLFYRGSLEETTFDKCYFDHIDLHENASRYLLLRNVQINHLSGTLTKLMSTIGFIPSADIETVKVTHQGDIYHGPFDAFPNAFIENIQHLQDRCVASRRLLESVTAQLFLQKDLFFVHSAQNRGLLYHAEPTNLERAVYDTVKNITGNRHSEQDDNHVIDARDISATALALKFYNISSREIVLALTAELQRSFPNDVPPTRSAYQAYSNIYELAETVDAETFIVSFQQPYVSSIKQVVSDTSELIREFGLDERHIYFVERGSININIQIPKRSLLFPLIYVLLNLDISVLYVATPDTQNFQLEIGAVHDENVEIIFNSSQERISYTEGVSEDIPIIHRLQQENHGTESGLGNIASEYGLSSAMSVSIRPERLTDDQNFQRQINGILRHGSRATLLRPAREIRSRLPGWTA